MTVRNVSEAKAELSALLVLVEQGEEVVIARSGKPIARIVAMNAGSLNRRAGALKGKIHIAEDFDAPDPEFERLVYGGDV